MITKDTFHPADPYNLTAEEEKFIESLSTAELRELSLRDTTEMERQAESQAKIDAFSQDMLDRRFEDHSPEDIANELRRRTQQAEIDAIQKAEAEASPERRAAEAEQRAKDNTYVAEEMEKRARGLVAQELAAQNAAVQKSLELQLMWTGKHPEYVRSAENGDLMRDYVSARYSEFTFANLEEAFGALQGKLNLLSPEQVQARQRMQAAVEEQVRVVPTRRSSTVSTNAASRSMYDTHELTETDFENMSTAELREYGRQHGQIDPEAEMHEGVRGGARHTSFLSAF